MDGLPSTSLSPFHWRRLRYVNTSRAEQVFSWFRGYARSFNSLRPIRHKFLVLYYSRLHNAMIAAGDVQHLNAYSPKRTGKCAKCVAKKGYACAMKKKKAMKRTVSMKKLKAMKAKKVMKTVRSQR